MSGPICVKDYEELAKEKLPKAVWDYYSSGANNEQTLLDNQQAFTRYRLRPHVLIDVSQVDLSSSVLGSTIDFPICIASTAMNKMAHPSGETAVVKAAEALNIGFMQSTWSTTSIEDVTAAAPNALKWMQLYIYKDREVTKQLVQRAERLGYKGFFVTVDTPVLGTRYRDVRNNFSLPSHLSLENFKSLDPTTKMGEVSGVDGSGLAQMVAALVDPSLQWSDIEWLKSITNLPIVLKGIITGEMAKQAVKANVAGILVSNHGARQLDGVPATLNVDFCLTISFSHQIDALREVVQAVDGKCEVYLDGGIRNGTDVIKAIAFGAKAVFLGRPILWGLAYNGEKGVRGVLEILQDEFKTALQLMG
uniref:(S)-2-hydroxy-acid oxidase n=1 Tax=Ciona savignyi TaxID=51511 RepID=H2YF76_CIOSA